MADNQDNEQQNQVEGQEVVEGQEAPVTEEVVTEEERTFTQADLDRIVSERIAEVKSKSSEELGTLYNKLEELSQQVQAQGRQQQVSDDPFAGIEDDPPPRGMTRDQAIMWDADKFNRLSRKKMAYEIESRSRQAIAPMVNDSLVKSFFVGKDKIPPHIQKATEQIFKQAVAAGNPTPPEKLVHGAYLQALAIDAEQGFMGTRQVSQTQKAPTNQPKVKTPNGSTDLGVNQRLPGTARVGSGSRSEKSYAQIKEELLTNNIFPEDELPKHLR